MKEVFENIKNLYDSPALIDSVVLKSVLLMTFILSIYEFIIYKYVSKRTFYNKSFNISLAVIPYFIATIILCLQSDIVITLGTIGALAIIRFRTAVKDPIDMLYILWSVHIGIMTGCQLYKVAVFTSLFVTVVLIILSNFSFIRKSYVLIVHTQEENEDRISNCLKGIKAKYNIKSRNYNNSSFDYAIELSIKNPAELVTVLNKEKSIERFSLIEYSSDDIV